MLTVGVIGLGMMGNTHLDVWTKLPGVKVLALSDINPDRLTGKNKAGGNIPGQAQGGFTHASARQYDEGMKLIADPEVQIVDICLPTPLHTDYAIAALKAGKHVLVEKPLARTAADARRLAQAAADHPKAISMAAMCMRFWPGWTWLKEAVDKQTYGPVRAAMFRRLASFPNTGFYPDGNQSGGAILDLHIHDTDFIQYCFGVPQSVRSSGYSKHTNCIDHVVTTYRYDNGPLVAAEGSWSMAKGFPFTMHYTVNFERATAVFDLASPKPLTLYIPDQPAQSVDLPAGMGYQYEIEYFLDCIQKGRAPSTVTLASAAKSVEIVEAEVASIQSRAEISLPPSRS